MWIIVTGIAFSKSEYITQKCKAQIQALAVSQSWVPIQPANPAFFLDNWFICYVSSLGPYRMYCPLLVSLNMA